MDYKNGKIYTIRSHQTEDFYIGSTTQPLSKRLYFHKVNYKYYINKKFHYLSSFEIVKYNDCYIEVLEEYPCDNKQQLTKREGELIRCENNCVNKRIEGRTRQEYLEVNKDKINELQREYNKQNKDKIKERKRQPFTCECGSIVRIDGKLEHLKSKKHQRFLQII